MLSATSGIRSQLDIERQKWSVQVRPPFIIIDLTLNLHLLSASRRERGPDVEIRLSDPCRSRAREERGKGKKEIEQSAKGRATLDRFQKTSQVSRPDQTRPDQEEEERVPTLYTKYYTGRGKGSFCWDQRLTDMATEAVAASELEDVPVAEVEAATEQPDPGQ